MNSLPNFSARTSFSAIVLLCLLAFSALQSNTQTTTVAENLSANID